jgi:hypothetical protein
MRRLIEGCALLGWWWGDEGLDALGIVLFVEVGLGGCIVGSVVKGCGGLGYVIQIEGSTSSFFSFLPSSCDLR